MKILYLINYAGGGGTEKYVLDLLDGFTAAGEKCYLAYNIPGLLSEQAAKRKISSFQFEMKNSYDVKAAKTLARICSQNKIDIVHAQHTRELYVACLSKLFGNKAKVVFTNHLLSECGKARKLTNSVLARPLCSKFITVCEKGRELMDKNGFGTSKTVTIFNGINTKRKDSYNNVREQLGIADDVFVITALTRYSPEKGVGFLIDSINELKKTAKRKFMLLIAGTGDMYDEMGQKIDDLGLNDVIMRLGYRNDTADLLESSDMFVNLSSTEALSFAIIEALSHGLPVVVTNVGGTCDIVNAQTDCGIAVSYGDTSMTAKAINAIMSDGALYEKYSANALKTASEKFSVSQMLEKTYSVYTSLIKK